MRIHLVRHGETTHNRDRICQGQYDSKLTDKGKKQAKLLGERLKGSHFSQIFSSDLSRAKHTTDEIVKHHKNNGVVLDKRLRERGQGDYENIPVNELNFDKYLSNGIHDKVPNGESIFEQVERVKEFLEETPLTDNTLIVSHGGTVKALLVNLLNLDLEKNLEYIKENFRSDNTSIYTLKYNGEKFEIEVENCTKHLK